MSNSSEYLFYMAPRKNAPWIALSGVFSYNRINTSDFSQFLQSIADPFVNNRRDSLQIEEKPLHDYVPLYWATHTPMQYVVKLPQDQLVFFVLEAAQILKLSGVITTDGNAASNDTKFFRGDGALPHLDWEIIQTPNCWSREYKRKKCAEVLVPDKIEPTLIRQICVFSTSSSKHLKTAICETAQNLKYYEVHIPNLIKLVKVDPNLYYGQE